MTVSRICIICSKDSNYKCPKCYEYYCSVACCKQHHGNGCRRRKSEQNVESDAKRRYKHITDDTVAEQKLKLLNANKKLKKILGNPHLRRIMDEIDSADNPSDLLSEAMREPIFVEFSDECLKVVQD